MYLLKCNDPLEEVSGVVSFFSSALFPEALLLQRKWGVGGTIIWSPEHFPKLLRHISKTK